jgi:hypothetical protein
MYMLHKMPVAVTEDNLEDVDWCWGIVHTTDIRLENVIQWGGPSDET